MYEVDQCIWILYTSRFKPWHYNSDFEVYKSKDVNAGLVTSLVSGQPKTLHWHELELECITIHTIDFRCSSKRKLS